MTDSLSTNQLSQMLSEASERSKEKTQQMNQLIGEGADTGAGELSSYRF